MDFTKITTALTIVTCDFILDPLESEDNDSEEDYNFLLEVLGRKRKMYNKRCPVRIKLYVENVVSNYTTQEFQSHFRVTYEGYQALLAKVGPLLRRNADVGRCTIDVEKQLLSVLWLLATPDSYRSIGERFNMGKSSLSVTFMRVIKALNEIAPQIITWPSRERLQSVERSFFQMAGIPGIIGAIDGTFIPIKAPKLDPEVYITRKCNHAITLQAVCDNTLKFSDIFVGFPGSVSDTRIFKNSDFYKEAHINTLSFFPNNEFILGDKAYPVLKWCIPPYIDHGNLTAAQRNFNFLVSQSRQTVERSFALLFGRFRRLKFLDMNRTDKIPATVLASCVLHNICLNYEDLLSEDYIREGMNHVHENENNEFINVPCNANEREGRDKRDQLCRSLFANI